MAKKEKLDEDFDINSIDTDPQETLTPVSKDVDVKAEMAKVRKSRAAYAEDQLVSCLRNERVIVRHVPKKGKYTDPKHVLSGGMADDATKVYVVPRLQSGVYVNVLTNAEKNFLEEVMGLEHDALSIYNRVNNFWDDSNEFGISRVRLKKQDNYLDLSIPDDYIRYKILLANKNFICPSQQELVNHPKATYEYVIISENEQGNVAAAEADSIVNAIELYSKYKDDFATLKTILEILDRRRISNDQKIEFLRAQVVAKIQEDSKSFIKIVSEPLFDTKVLIKKAVTMGIIADRGGYLFQMEKNLPLCDSGQEPTLDIAARYLTMPRQSELLFSIQAAVKS